MKDIKINQIEHAVRLILEAVGEDVEREGLLDTPRRVAKMYGELFSGLHEDPGKYFETIFHENHDGLVLVKDISFYSMCEHHLLPFFGRAHVAYIPEGGRVVGLSKLARAVETVARRPQLQERMTRIVADTIMEKLNPLGVAVVVEAEHMCMTMRGIKKPGSITVTTAVRGIFAEDKEAKNEVLARILK
ncbi:MAG: GTP cyclohydrolase I FolE [Caldibacillus debilis]|jgi:GTP cyclohydrolase IA|uniref:GTP cyclohydrolase 1 n=1 Tax=Caldibacillus debilis TaxID=301148 RepID=A0A150M7C7_9BACI|nr:GTP cyclohydrolase I FolE [Caldibacillus debilis]MBO2480780.1 GTP cyclohydrolase I FolE [Bacillaceae bacterium]KYD20251.1 GTP cyclohydrolase I type 1 [Caldibacillus debilis]MBY6273175.1 GTP cyclohydrolase I FolE [Bacillaceae bacterium]OUM93028.1 MAG: GTP cyclohydrolase I FolE [Caldibacillus debilis]REJ16539.1 MAG: GTP cyclohydrolase I FolE [Caldibacillus debilis]